MLKARLAYGAISAKVLALYGKLLSENDWSRLRDCTSPAEVLSVLKALPGWSGYVSELSASSDTERLKQTIRSKHHRDYEKLYRFCSLSDKRLLSLLLIGEEYNYILAALRCLYSGESVRLPAETTDFMRAHSSVDVKALEEATGFSAVCAAAKDSIFFGTLAALSPPGSLGLPDYSKTGVALERCYYQYVFSEITKKYSGTGKEELVRLLGTEADLLNIVGILRLLRYFPDSLSKAPELLVPVYGKLKPRLMQELLLAQSETEAVERLKQSAFAAAFEDYRPEELDRLYERAMGALCRRIVKMPAPNICVPVAYLTLSELECTRLVRIIEALGYGINPD